MQEVLVSLVRSLPSIRGTSSLTTWAYTVARRACHRQRLRAGGSASRLDPEGSGRPDGTPLEPVEPLELADPDVDLERDVERRELESALRNALLALPPTYREAVILRDLEGLPARGGGACARRERAGAEVSPPSRAERPAGGARAAIRNRVGIDTSGGVRGDGSRDEPLSRRGSRRPGLRGDGSAPTRLGPCGEACRSLRRALTLCQRAGARPLSPGVRQSLRRVIRAAMAELARSEARSVGRG